MYRYKQTHRYKQERLDTRATETALHFDPFTGRQVYFYSELRGFMRIILRIEGKGRYLYSI